MTRKAEYSNRVVTFDIETSSFYQDDKKQGITYTWTIADGDEVTVHRSLEAFKDHLWDIRDRVPQHMNMVVWVQNLGYEWQWIKHYFQWREVFANGSSTNVIRATTRDGIEFRCSYALTNLPLHEVGRQVGVPKMVGDLDYELLRTPVTPLTNTEMGYIVNDVKIIVELVRERHQEDSFSTMPMTKTGYVRRTLAKAVASPDYGMMIRELTMSPEVYTLARASYQGGFTHANAAITGKVLNDVVAYDLSSSYPSSLAQFEYPMSKFDEVEGIDSIESLEEAIGCGCMFIDVELVGARSRYPFPVISESKASRVSEGVIDNGRVFAAGRLRVMVTDVDWRLIRRCYEADDILVHGAWIAASDYLPTPLVETILGFYKKKSALKGVAGAEVEYNVAKENTNTVYGCIGTDPVREEFTFNDSDKSITAETMNVEEAINKVNSDRKRILFYPWACWCTAYSRYVLLSTMFDLIDAGVTVAYCDTDSIYAVNDECVEGIISSANERIAERMHLALQHHGLDDSYTNPTDKNGHHHPLGAFDCETADEHISEFKTLGAKRYAKRIGSKFSITVAGLSKKAAAYVEENGGMDFFADGMTIPAEYSGRITHAYSEEEVDLVVRDYLGNIAEVQQKGFIHLEKSTYHMGLSDAYTNFIEAFADDLVRGR